MKEVFITVTDDEISFKTVLRNKQDIVRLVETIKINFSYLEEEKKK